jgi:hypothetical protein
MSETTSIIDRDAKSGRFIAGNAGNGGRRPGARSKLGEQFLQDLAATWEKHGMVALERAATEEPAQFVRVIANLLPRDVDINLTGTMDVATFAERFRHAVELLGNAPSRKLTVIENADGGK